MKYKYLEIEGKDTEAITKELNNIANDGFAIFKIVEALDIIANGHITGSGRIKIIFKAVFVKTD